MENDFLEHINSCVGVGKRKNLYEANSEIGSCFSENVPEAELKFCLWLFVCLIIIKKLPFGRMKCTKERAK